MTNTFSNEIFKKYYCIFIFIYKLKKKKKEKAINKA